MNTNDIISKLNDTEKLVMIGKNGVGKTYQLLSIKKKYDSSMVASENNLPATAIYIGYDFTSQFDDILISLLDNSFINKEQKEYEAMVNKIEHDIDSIKQYLSDFDQEITDYKFDIMNSKHEINSNEDILNKSKVSIKTNHDNGHGNDFYIKLKLLLKLTDIINERARKKNNKKVAEVVLLVDEPERYCFPGLSIKLSKLLKTCNTKVICSSHSPTFVSNFIDDFSKLILIKNRETIVNFSTLELIESIDQTYKIDLKGQNYGSKKTLFSQRRRLESHFNTILKPEIIECLYSDLVILVEGATDKQLIRYLMNTKSIKLDINCYTVQTNGKNIFPMYISILQKFNTTIFSMFDMDTNENIHLIYNNYIKKNSSAYYGFDIDIEKSFSLDSSTTNEKVHVGPTLLLIELIDNEEKHKHLIDTIASKISLCYSENIVGAENVKREISKLCMLLDELTIGENDRIIGEYYPTYKLLKKLVIKLFKEYGELYNELSSNKKMHFSYYNLKYILEQINISYNNYVKIITEKSSSLYNGKELNEGLYALHLMEKQKFDKAKEIIRYDNSIYGTDCSKYKNFIDSIKNEECKTFDEYIVNKIRLNASGIDFEKEYKYLKRSMLNGLEVEDFINYSLMKVHVQDALKKDKLTFKVKRQITTELKNFNDKVKKDWVCQGICVSSF